MKIFNCLLPCGKIKKMTLAKVIKYKRKGLQVKIIDIAYIKEKDITR